MYMCVCVKIHIVYKIRLHGRELLWSVSASSAIESESKKKNKRRQSTHSSTAIACAVAQHTATHSNALRYTSQTLRASTRERTNKKKPTHPESEKRQSDSLKHNQRTPQELRGSHLFGGYHVSLKRR